MEKMFHEQCTHTVMFKSANFLITLLNTREHFTNVTQRTLRETCKNVIQRSGNVGSKLARFSRSVI